MDPSNSIAYLGPAGTYTESAALRIRNDGDQLCPYPTIATVLEAVAAGEVRSGVVPVENSVEGGVSMTLDTLWQLEGLRIREALILPIQHTLISLAPSLAQITTVYSHPQALAQSQLWLRRNLPHALQVASRSNTEEIGRVQTDPSAAVIASERAAQIYQLPILAYSLNDHPDNCTRFWVVSTTADPNGGSYTSLAFSLPENVPGALLRPLQIFAARQMNMTRIESRPTKKSAGTYVFFIDLEHPNQFSLAPEILQELLAMSEVLKVFGSYPLISWLESDPSLQ